MKHGRILQVLGVVLALGGTSWAQVTRRVSVSSAGAQSDSWSDFSSISVDGSLVTFRSFASNLVAGDTNGFRDVFCRGVFDGQTVIASVASDESPGNQASGPQSASADGRYVAFSSSANNLVPGDTNGGDDIFVRDVIAGTTTRISVSSGGVQGNGNSISAAISADGNYVAYRSSSTNLVFGDSNGTDDIFVTNRLTGVTERVSLGENGVQANSTSDYPSISADGRYVAFESGADNLIGAHNDTNQAFDIFRRDRIMGVTVIMSVGSGNGQGNGHSLFPSISADGDAVAFASAASNLVGSDTNGVADVFVHTQATPSTRIVSVSSSQILGNGASGAPSLSADGKYVAFESVAANLVPGDTNGVQDVFVRDLLLATTERASLGSSGAEGDARSSWPSISGDGRFVAFESDATNLVAGDTNGLTDIFVRDRDTTGFTSVCHPGLEGVQLCPCSNQPSPADRGCDNSSGTGGALLSASGTSYLSMDSLVFTTSGERPTAFSIVLQGDSFVPAGVIYGQGLRCAGGSLKRLYSKHASGGSITAPNLGAGDPTVSARSAAMGDAIQPGESRWYLVYYRDPIVLGGCSANSTFNATQTGQVTWLP
ncbi:MAG TPA: hypothetical protein VGR31_01185 [Planctomycetota bacterium]|jgi:Tol biopolymer transport system component|nr:hypothetical protein [Planctomycetota bacterium]